MRGIRRQLCPRWRRGRIFQRPIYRGWLAMFERCPECGLQFEREQGYFLGAMYASYGLSIPPVLPVVARYARVLWMYIDQAIDSR